MNSTTRACLTTTLLAVMLGSSQLIPATALADELAQQNLHNVTYRVRIDGVSRGATITYNIADKQVETTNPSMVPGRTFEANTVLADPQHAGMEVSIKWPYSANLHCEILVDDAMIAQADDFVAPRFLPQSNDPGYGVLACGGPLANAAAVGAGSPPADAPPNGAPPSQASPTQTPPAG